ncbi:hypothetical protein V1505DRAFT_87742 [Lipomyces doorenjongii]
MQVGLVGNILPRQAVGCHDYSFTASMKPISRHSRAMIWHKIKPQLSISVDNSIVTAGSPVSGIVDLELDRPTIIDAVKVRFRGISMTTELKYSSPSPYSGYISPEQQKLREWHIHIDITTTLFEGQKVRHFLLAGIDYPL